MLNMDRGWHKAEWIGVPPCRGLQLDPADLREFVVPPAIGHGGSSGFLCGGAGVANDGSTLPAL